MHPAELWGTLTMVYGKCFTGMGCSLDGVCSYFELLKIRAPTGPSQTPVPPVASTNKGFSSKIQ